MPKAFIRNMLPLLYALSACYCKERKIKINLHSAFTSTLHSAKTRNMIHKPDTLIFTHTLKPLK